jgi:hypothetical protein
MSKYETQLMVQLNQIFDEINLALSELESTWQTQGLNTNYMLAELEQDKILLI